FGTQGNVDVERQAWRHLLLTNQTRCDNWRCEFVVDRTGPFIFEFLKFVKDFGLSRSRRVIFPMPWLAFVGVEAEAARIRNQPAVGGQSPQIGDVGAGIFSSQVEVNSASALMCASAGRRHPFARFFRRTVFL